MQLSQEELKIIRDVDFLLTKISAIDKIAKLFETTRTHLELVVREPGSFCPPESILKEGKISKGENYRNLPYLVLDYPAFFSKDDIFAFRTMFWWGHFFSFTLHLQGKYLAMFRGSIIDKLDTFNHQGTYVSVGDTPWEYHYAPDNYARINQIDARQIAEVGFLKISKKIDLDQWSLVPELAKHFFISCLGGLE